jgi:hypothetical protein
MDGLYIFLGFVGLLLMAIGIRFFINLRRKKAEDQLAEAFEKQQEQQKVKESISTMLVTDYDNDHFDKNEVRKKLDRLDNADFYPSPKVEVFPDPVTGSVISTNLAPAGTTLTPVDPDCHPIQTDHGACTVSDPTPDPSPSHVPDHSSHCASDSHISSSSSSDSSCHVHDSGSSFSHDSGSVSHDLGSHSH